jgi:hypothetical protein
MGKMKKPFKKCAKNPGVVKFWWGTVSTASPLIKKHHPEFYCKKGKFKIKS